MIQRLVACVLVLSLALLAAGCSAAEAEGKTPRLLDHLPMDPLLAQQMHGGTLAETFDGMVGMLGQFAGEDETAQVREKLAAFDAEIGFSLRDDLLANLGPDFAWVVDLPPIDSLMAAAQQPEAMIESATRNLGLLAAVRDADKVHASLRALLTKDGGEIVESDGLMRLKPAASDGPAAGAVPGVAAVYGIRNGVLAFGLSEEFVRASLSGRPKGARLADGEDFRQVFSHLDPDPATFTYINLPKVRTMVESSAMLQMLLAANEDAKPVMTLIKNPEITGRGFGSTSVEVDGGVRTTSYGPSIFGGGTAATGIVAAIAVPNLLNAIDRGKQKRTLADIRSVATAVESYAIDNEVYPMGGAGWIPVSELTPAIQPNYIRAAPTADGWGHPLMYWCDGKSYRIVSHGKDGVPMQDWAAESGGGATSSFDDDIVMADGMFTQWPEGTQR